MRSVQLPAAGGMPCGRQHRCAGRLCNWMHPMNTWVSQCTLYSLPLPVLKKNLWDNWHRLLYKLDTFLSSNQQRQSIEGNSKLNQARENHPMIHAAWSINWLLKEGTISRALTWRNRQSRLIYSHVVQKVAKTTYDTHCISKEVCDYVKYCLHSFDSNRWRLEGLWRNLLQVPQKILFRGPTYLG